MWARVKGRTENAVRRPPFRRRTLPAGVHPAAARHSIEDGVLSHLLHCRWRSFLSVARRWFPNAIVTTEQFGQAMLNVARRGWPTPVLEQRDIARASRVSGPPKADLRLTRYTDSADSDVF